MRRLALVIFFLALAAEPSSAQQCGHYFPAGAAAFRNDSYQRSVRYLSAGIMCRKPDILGTVPSYYARAMGYYALGQNMEAAADFSDVIERELRWREIVMQPPRLRGRIHVGWTHLYRGLALYRGGQNADARSEFETALTWRPVRDPISPHVDQPFYSWGFPMHRVFKGVSLDAAALYGRGLARIRQGDAAGGNSDLAMAAAMEPGIAARMSELGVAQ